MIDLLTKPAFQKRALPISVQTWHGMIDKNLVPARSELLRGIIVEKKPKSILHIKLAGRLFQYLLATLNPALYWTRKEDPLTTADSEPEPDVSVVTGTEADYDSHPTTALLAVEVAVTTLDEDREMAAIYAETGVGEFWIVNAQERCIEVYRQPGPAGYASLQTIHEDGVLRSAALPGVEIDVAQLFAGLPRSLESQS